MKTLTRNQLQGRKEKAARFVETVLGESERADEIENESLESYAARRKITLVENPQKRGSMAKATLEQRILKKVEERYGKGQNPRGTGKDTVVSAAAEAELRRLREENEALQARLDKVAELAEEPEHGEEDDPIDTLNEILDVVAPEDDDEDDDEGNG